MNAAGSGDTIIVRDGTYTENVNVNKRLTIRSENGSASTTVQASNLDDHVFEGIHLIEKVQPLDVTSIENLLKRKCL